MPLITVFTPAYNRAHTLPRTYQSLKNQDNKDFVWLIVDDGSTDNTKELVENWQQEDNEFEIRYIYKENGGMHTAHNTAYENIDTELNLCIDSDDMLAEGAITKISEKWREVKEKNYAGIMGLDVDMNTKKVIGTGFNDSLTDTRIAEYYSTGGCGDKKYVYRTDIVNKYPPYPVFEGEKYVGLEYKYRLIDRDYRLAVLNDVLCEVEYQADGSSNTMYRQYLKNPKGFAFLRLCRLQQPDSQKRAFVDCVHYVAESTLAGNKNFIKESPKKMMTIVSIPMGLLLLVYIKIKAKK